MRILIVEDDALTRMLLQNILSDFGYCDIVENGLEALDAFEQTFSEGLFYDLICLDIMMPQMDGQQVLKEIRKRELKKGLSSGLGTKIIMTTSLQDSKNIIQAYHEKCDAYLSKPIKKSELLDQLKSLGLINNGNRCAEE